MSISVTNLLWNLRVSSTEKLVLIRLGDFAHDDGSRIFPSVETVAADCGLTDRAVQTTLKKLMNAGILVLVRSGGGRGRTAEYAIDLGLVRSLIENPEVGSGFEARKRPSRRRKNPAPHSPFPDRNPERRSQKGESGSQNPERDSPDPLRTIRNPAADDARAPPAPPIVTVGMEVLRLIGVADDPRWFGSYGRVQQWLASGADPDLDIYPTIQRVMTNRGTDGPPRSLAYFDRPIADAIASRTRPLPMGAFHPSKSHQRRGEKPANRFEAIVERDLRGEWNGDEP